MASNVYTLSNVIMMNINITLVYVTKSITLRNTLY